MTIRPRDIPVADVTLDEAYNVHLYPTFVADVRPTELFNENLVAWDEKLGGKSSEFTYVQDDLSTRPNKFLVSVDTSTDTDLYASEGLILVGKYMVLDSVAYTYNTAVSASNTGKATYEENTWGGSVGDQIDNFKTEEVEATTWVNKRATSKKGALVWHNLTSNFKLSENQPFFLWFKLGVAPPRCGSAVENWFDESEGSTGLPSWKQALIPKRVRKGTGVTISFGDYKLTVFSNPLECNLWKPKADGSYTHIDRLPLTADKSGAVGICVYPVANDLYIYNGAISTENTKKKRYIVYTDTKRITYKDRIYLEFFGGTASMAFAPLVHVQEATLESIYYDIPFTVVTDHLDILCAGKKVKQVSENAANIITWKDDNEDDAEYIYLKGAKITGSLHTYNEFDGSIQRYYKTTLTARSVVTLDDTSRQRTAYYSPAVYAMHYWAESPTEDIDLQPNPQISNADVRQLTITESVEGNSAQIVLNNRLPTPEKWTKTTGKYSYPNGSTNFCGVKPITIKLGYKGETTEAEKITRFSGFVTDRQYSRPNSSESNVVLVCSDRSKQLKESYAFNLPIYDGWCNLAVIYDLGKEAGFTDDNLLLYQNPVTGGDTIKLVDLITNAESTTATKSGACYDGHIDGFPAGIPGKFLGETIPGSLLHHKVSTAPLLSPPQWMFEMGTSIWDCMLRVRSYNHFLLFVNNFGNLVYCPPHFYYASSPQLTFRDQPTAPGDYNEVQQSLSVTQSTQNMRNAVNVGGLLSVGSNPDVSRLVPTYLTRMSATWQTDVSEHSYAPWLRLSFNRDPMVSDPHYLSFKANELWRRMTRDMRTITFATWGNPEVYPYQIIRFIEQTGEAGTPVTADPGDGALYIIGSVTHQLNEDKTYITTIDAEIFEPDKYTFSPLEV